MPSHCHYLACFFTSSTLTTPVHGPRLRTANTKASGALALRLHADARTLVPCEHATPFMWLKVSTAVIEQRQ